MDIFVSKMTELLSSIRPVITMLVIAALVVVGIMFIYPSERSKEKAKSALPWIVIGAAISLLAVNIGNWLTSGF